jgi:hypothetical protein
MSVCVCRLRGLGHVLAFPSIYCTGCDFDLVVEITKNLCFSTYCSVLNVSLIEKEGECRSFYHTYCCSHESILSASASSYACSLRASWAILRHASLVSPTHPVSHVFLYLSSVTVPWKEYRSCNAILRQYMLTIL